MANGWLYEFKASPHYTFLIDLYFFATRWEDDVVNMLDKKDQKHKILVSFECETLKAGKAAEDHINKFMPKLAGTDAVGKLPNCINLPKISFF